VGRAGRPEVRRLNLGARQFELLFHWLYDLEKSASFDITPREGYHYRRVLLQRRAAGWASRGEFALRGGKEAFHTGRC
jgi:hypothetical protein